MDDQSTQQNRFKKPNPLGKLIKEVKDADQVQGEVGPEQETLNKPLVDPTGVSPEDQAFLQDIVSKVESGQINPHQPSSLINTEIYDKLSEEQQGKVDINAMTLLSNVRQIKELHDLGHTDTYQIQNLVNSCRLMKERVEQDCGDCYII